MFYASKVGLQQIYDRICYYWREHGETIFTSFKITELQQNVTGVKNGMKHSKKYDAPSCEGHENSSVTVLTIFAGTSHHWTPSKLLKRLADGTFRLNNGRPAEKATVICDLHSKVQLHYIIC